MDSLTQIALGASIAGAVGSKVFGRKVLIAGAVLGTVPDLDVFVDYGGVVENYVFHRSFSHSLFVLAAFSIILYLLTIKFKPHYAAHKGILFTVIFLPLITHPLLDAFTSYGTQLFWPLSTTPVAWNSIFIIDPLYTLPLLIAILGLWFSRNTQKWQRINSAALFLSCLYLGFGQYAQWSISRQIENDKIVENGQVLIVPTPFNTLLWRVVSYHDDKYYEALALLGRNQPLQWHAYKHNRELIKGLQTTHLKQLEWMSRGYLRFDSKDNKLIVTDIRMGTEELYPFSFVIAENSGSWQAVVPTQEEVVVEAEQVLSLFKDVFN
ncbi:metal-dependent hydrolase [Psychromonas ossibalaenae]|uniref:metal-dependent hydrolase n=1 Tax=Psychromonas ossibalaenae TaxID=444922 RepID=UPI00037E8847|nr:metal-dependent hydrolase [Psychromonas ossibalaenae]